MVCKIGFTNCNAKIPFLRARMVVTYYIKLFQMGDSRHNGILMSLLLLVAETITKLSIEKRVEHQLPFEKYISLLIISFT